MFRCGIYIYMYIYSLFRYICIYIHFFFVFNLFTEHPDYVLFAHTQTMFFCVNTQNMFIRMNTRNKFSAEAPTLSCGDRHEFVSIGRLIDQWYNIVVIKIVSINIFLSIYKYIYLIL